MSRKKKEDLASAWGERKEGEGREENIPDGAMRGSVKSKIIPDDPKEGRARDSNQESSDLSDFPVGFALKFSSDHGDTPIFNLNTTPGSSYDVS